MTRERWAFVAAALALWALYFVQALWSPILLDDWFQLRYWREHELGLGALWQYGHHNYFHYNPRIGEVFLAIVDGSRLVHVIVTPLVQLSLVPIVFVIAFARWPRPTLRDLQLLVFLQVMIWLVIPIPGILYFYRPFTTNYLWGFTLTLALFVPYRLALARDDHRRRLWLVPLLLVLGWIAGMCNEHTGPTAMVAIAAVVVIAYRRHQLRAWMVAGMVGLYIGYPMLFFAPGQSVRYSGLATRATPTRVLAERGLGGCVDIVFAFLGESWLGIMLFLAAVASYAIRRRARPAIPRDTVYLLAAAFAIVGTLFVSPTASDRVFFASGVLLVGALAIVVERIFVDRDVRRLVVGACVALALYHCARFIDTGVRLDAATDQRLALLRAAKPGSVAVVPAYAHTQRSRWYFGDDLVQHPWLRDYVGGELFDLAGIDLDRAQPRGARVRYVPSRSYDPALASLPLLLDTPTYRAWLDDPASRARVARQIDPQLQRLTVHLTGLAFEDRRRRPIVAYEWTPRGFAFVDGRPYDDLRGHFIRIAPSTIPPNLDSTWIAGCGFTWVVAPIDDGAHTLLPIDERECRGPFTALMCQRDRCWVAGWY